MNGGRLSDDEVFRLGMEELRRQLNANPPDPEATQQALTRVGLRFPDQAGELRQSWPQRERCERLLQELEAQHRLESEE